MDTMDPAVSRVILAGTRASSLLKALLKTSNIPAHHVSHVREIVDHYDSSYSQYINASYKEVARG